jgi:hypothetical protein
MGAGGEYRTFSPAIRSKCFFEVKRRSSDALQKIPALLEAALKGLGKEIGF